MARYSGSRWLPIKETNTQARIKPNKLILHSIAAPWGEDRVREFWNTVNTESHFAVDYDGSSGQFIDTNVRADANVSANNSAISIETAANVRNTDAWTEAQIAEMVRIMVWAHKTHGIPARICRSATDAGYGVHRMFPTWSFGGTYCPGDKRTAQFHSTVFPRFLKAIGAKSSSSPWVSAKQVISAAKAADGETGTGAANSKDDVLLVQKALAAKVGLNYSSGPGTFGPATKAAYKKYQQSLGYSGSDADGIPGKSSLIRLGESSGKFRAHDF